MAKKLPEILEPSDAPEARNKQQAHTVMVGLMLATVGAIAFAFRTHRRLARKEIPV